MMERKKKNPNMIQFADQMELRTVQELPAFYSAQAQLNNSISWCGFWEAVRIIIPIFHAFTGGNRTFNVL